MLLALMSRCAEPYGYKQEKGGRAWCTIVGGFNHNFNTEPTTPDAARAYAALCSAIDELDSEGPTEVVIEPGTALIFNNCRVLHARRAIESGSRWLQRVYGTANLEAMQTASGSEGPIFDALRFL